MIRAFQRIRTTNAVLEKLQSNVENSFRPLNASQIIDGNLIEDVALRASAPRTINHLLGRSYRGWIVVRRNADCVIWESPTSNMKQELILNTIADVTVSLWIF